MGFNGLWHLRRQLCGSLAALATICALSGRAETDQAGPPHEEPRVIDLPTALRLADRINPEIGIARQAILESLALEQGARVLLLPSITGGGNYHDHNGNLQRSRGAILDVPAEQSLYFGGGARTLAAESVAYPAIRIFAHLGDAIYEPLAARQQVKVRQLEAGATFNSILLEVSTSYLELMGAEAQFEVLEASHHNAVHIADVTGEFARIGQGRQADADRMATEARLIESEIQRALERTAVAAAELARLLNLDPTVQLRTARGPIPVLELVDPKCKLDELLEIALRQRPDLAARGAEVAEREIRFRQERTRALLPTISVGFSAGSFGGGSNLVDPHFGRFAGRTDFDVLAFWTAQNLGIGNVARWRERRGQANEAAARRARTLNLARREVAEAYADSLAQNQAIELSQRRLREAEQGFEEEFLRIRGGQGLPIELLDNLTRLVSAREALVESGISYNKAQFRLFVALGQPPPETLKTKIELDPLREDRP
jgi:outer membrane protein TolC